MNKPNNSTKCASAKTMGGSNSETGQERLPVELPKRFKELLVSVFRHLDSAEHKAKRRAELAALMSGPQSDSLKLAVLQGWLKNAKNQSLLPDWLIGARNAKSKRTLWELSLNHNISLLEQALASQSKISEDRQETEAERFPFSKRDLYDLVRSHEKTLTFEAFRMRLTRKPVVIEGVTIEVKKVNGKERVSGKSYHAVKSALAAKSKWQSVPVG